MDPTTSKESAGACNDSPVTSPNPRSGEIQRLTKYRGNHYPLYAGKRCSHPGLFHRKYEDAHPDAKPRAICRNNGNTIPLWHPDDWCEWVPVGQLDRSARSLAARVREIEEKKRMEWMERNHRAFLAYNASDSTLTRRVLKELESLGQLGRIAAALFRAQKASTRAKQYRGGTAYGRSYTDLAYARKENSLRSLCDLLSQDAAGLTWGWGEDSKQDFARQVLYVDLPAGQVSFHSMDRHNGPDYACEWDGVSGVSQVRILQLCDDLLRNRAAASEPRTRRRTPPRNTRSSAEVTKARPS